MGIENNAIRANKSNDELIKGLEESIKLKEIHYTLDDFRYPHTHLKLILAKVLLDYYNGDVRKVKSFLCEYDHHLIELTEILEC